MRFSRLLAERNPDPDGRRWIYVPYDQLTARLGPLSREDPEDLGIVLVENASKAGRRPYHKQKLASVLANMRHFALEQAARGVAIEYLAGRGTYRDLLSGFVERQGPLRMMEAAERELRVDLEPLVRDGGIEVLTHEGWLTDDDDFEEACAGRKNWRMDAFYRHVRKRTQILVEDGKPVGGKWSYDVENRKAWKGKPPAPDPPTFPVNEIDEEVAELIEREFADHPGRIDLESLPTTAEDAAAAWDWARREAMPHFGPYEDAMSTESRTLFHTRISALLNLHRVLPRDVVDDVLDLDIPLASKEGFVRQVLGWREFVRHVHLRTDGFRSLPDGAEPPRSGTPDEGASPSALGAHESLPAAYWGEESGLYCLDEVVESVWEEGYGHHITRLMVLSNLATLLDVSPRELTDWFWVAYADAFDWVVEPNVLGMGTYAVADLMTTKPYVSGAAYINRMSDYCKSCAFDPRRTCPITRLYWAFLARKREQLDGNPRLAMPYRSLEKRDREEVEEDARIFEVVSEVLGDGRKLTPDDLEGP